MIFLEVVSCFYNIFGSCIVFLKYFWKSYCVFIIFLEVASYFYNIFGSRIVSRHSSFVSKTNWNSYNYQTSTCLRGWRLSASWGPDLGPFWNPSTLVHYVIEGYKGALNCAPFRTAKAIFFDLSSGCQYI